MPFHFYYREVHCVPLSFFGRWHWTAVLVLGERRIPLLTNSVSEIRRRIDEVLSSASSEIEDSPAHSDNAGGEDSI